MAYTADLMPPNAFSPPGAVTVLVLPELLAAPAIDSTTIAVTETVAPAEDAASGFGVATAPAPLAEEAAA